MNEETPLEKHYRIEKHLAQKLRNSSPEARRAGLYKSVYDELFATCEQIYGRPFGVSTNKEKKIASAMRILDRFLDKESVFLEIGSGRCELSIFLSEKVRSVYALEVASELDPKHHAPRNLNFVLSDGVNIPVPEGSITVAYSSQVMEHLHPDDAVAQLINIRRALAPGGVYVCVTPNSLSGPHDVSKYFDHVATGLHLKEYQYNQLSSLFHRVGFSKVYAIGTTRFCKGAILIPLMFQSMIEHILSVLPRGIRRSLARARLGPLSLNHVRIVAVK